MQKAKKKQGMPTSSGPRVNLLGLGFPELGLEVVPGLAELLNGPWVYAAVAVKFHTQLAPRTSFTLQRHRVHLSAFQYVPVLGH